MRFQFVMRLIAISLMAAISLITVAGLMPLSINLDVRSAQAQAAATATPRSASTPITYSVQSGDTFNAIARQFNLTPQELQLLNAITNTGVIRVGQILIVGVNTFTPTAIPTDTPTPAPTAAPTQTPTALPPDTPTREPARAPTAAPTLAPTAEPVPTDRPVATAVPPAIEPPATTNIPIDVILVGAVMLFAVIGIVIGFRTQRG